MKTLKVIADWRNNENAPSSRKIKDIPIEERDNNSWWYLHGELEDFVRFDKATVTNCKSGGFAKETINWTKSDGYRVFEVGSEEPFYKMYYNGIVKVEIEGIEKPCIGYFYTTDEYDIIYKGVTYKTWTQRGLVCFSDDFESRRYALDKMNEKCTYL